MVHTPPVNERRVVSSCSTDSWEKTTISVDSANSHDRSKGNGQLHEIKCIYVLLNNSIDTTRVAIVSKVALGATA